MIPFVFNKHLQTSSTPNYEACTCPDSLVRTCYYAKCIHRTSRTVTDPEGSQCRPVSTGTRGSIQQAFNEKFWVFPPCLLHNNTHILTMALPSPRSYRRPVIDISFPPYHESSISPPDSTHDVIILGFVYHTARNLICNFPTYPSISGDEKCLAD